MKRLVQCAMALILTACSGAPFTFVHMSDTQIGFIDPSPVYWKSDSLMAAAVKDVNGIGPEMVFITGDLINEPYNTVQDSIYRTRKAEIKAPVYEVPGNHDIMKFTQEKRQHYLDWRGYDRFSFTSHGCAFIGIDSNCIKDGDAAAEAAQKEWLVEELSKAARARYTFIFLHCPVIRESLDEEEDYFNFPLDKRREYISLFKEHGVDAVFAGHTHMDYSTVQDGISFYTAGPVGSPLGRGFSGYNVVRVSKTGFSAEYVKTGSR